MFLAGGGVGVAFSDLFFVLEIFGGHVNTSGAVLMATPKRWSFIDDSEVTQTFNPPYNYMLAISSF